MPRRCSCCPFELGVALEEHGHVGVHLEGLDHLLRFSPGELGDAAPGEVVGDLYVQPGLADEMSLMRAM